MDVIRPTKKQRELLGFIDDFVARTGYGPSYREIMKGLDYKSVSTVASHVDNLISRGQLSKRENSARSLEVVHGLRQENPSPSSSHETWLNGLVRQKFVELEQTQSKDENKINELKIVVEALRILGLDTEHASLSSKLEGLS